LSLQAADILRGIETIRFRIDPQAGNRLRLPAAVRTTAPAAGLDSAAQSLWEALRA
jgi:hypothetical protein